MDSECELNEDDYEIIGHPTEDADIWRSNDIELLDSSFEILNLSKNLLNGLKTAGFTRPSRLQSQAIPLGRIGQDLLIQSKSGTGKTLIFAVVALDLVCLDFAACQVLILAPTREIAFQITNVIKSIACHLPELSVQNFIGGTQVKTDVEHLQKCHIAVGTPGRINQLLDEKILTTHSLRLLVLDEADQMVNEQMRDQVHKIVKQLPESRQTLAVSATFSDQLELFADNYMIEATLIKAQSECINLMGIQLYKYSTHLDLRYDFDFKVKSIQVLLQDISFTQALIFSNYQTRAESLVKQLNNQGFRCALISSHLAQVQRLKIVKNMKRLQINVIVCTDLLARGFDCEHVNFVINLDVPWDEQTFLHRVGRAGRFGRQGLALTFVSNGEDHLRMLQIERKLGVNAVTINCIESLVKLWNHQHCSLFNEPLSFKTLINEIQYFKCSDPHLKTFSELLFEHTSQLIIN